MQKTNNKSKLNKNELNSSGIFTISLDFERMWGLYDLKLEGYDENIEGINKAIDAILNIFCEFGIHSTWATVGLLFFKDINELNKNLPEKKPNYDNLLNAYQYINEHSNLDQNKHFSPDTIIRISKVAGQEIGSHTFSHFYCLEKGQSVDEFDCDIQSAVKVAKKFNLDLKSLVFPRNQFDTIYLKVLKKYKIASYRGNEKHWVYHNGYRPDDQLLKRAIRFLDSYLNISGNNCYSLNEVSNSSPYNIRSSYFLRPFSNKLKYLERLKEKRILDSMTYAAKNNKIFHLWWHPHNFGANLENNISFLYKILNHFHQLEKQYGMTSLNMGEISNTISEYQNGRVSN